MNKKDIKVCIIEDEKDARLILEKFIMEDFPQIEICGTASSYEDGLKLINKKKPDIIFLDINLKGGSGIELAKEIEDPASVKIMFTTAYDEYAIEALRLKASDYLLKPIFREDFKQALYLVIKELSPETNQKIRIQVKNLDGVHFLNPENIQYIEGSGVYSTFTMKDESRITTSKPLNYFSDIINNFQFIYRCHKSYIVNLKFVSNFQLRDNFLHLHSGKKIPVSRTRKKELKDLMDQF